MPSVLSSIKEGKELVMIPEGILMAQSMTARNFPSSPETTLNNGSPSMRNFSGST
ncbi:hypothetical protein DSO57_1022257 [Entomophthora muscae]|uniref:Uncharacterized protein n=1 Tax=Entomophthora muscae TaxID=34485 RepID=A0ACC2RHR9_9FUNG|nr:hypothetical protein DSO57_1022257 [Entomophthora muscae]